MDYPTPASLTLYDYPPRVLFDITPSENADSCTLQLGVTGMSKDVDFQVPLRARSGSLSTPQGDLTSFVYGPLINLRTYRSD